MRARLLVFDPDIEGRRLIREALSNLDLDLSIILRKTGETASQSLSEIAVDGILLGLPADLSEIAPILFQLQSIGQCPPLFFFHERPSPVDSWLTKDDEGFDRIRKILIPQIRAFQLGRAVSSLSIFLDEAEGRARSHLARQVTEILASLDISAIYVSVDPNQYWWELRSSNFPQSVDAEIIAISDAYGGVAPKPEALSKPLNELFEGYADDYTFKPIELLSQLIPGADTGTLQRLEQMLNVEWIYVIAVRTEFRLNGFLLLGKAPEGPERKAFRNLGKQFGMLLTQAEEYDLLNQQARSMQALQDVMFSLSATLDVRDLFETVIDNLEQIVPFDLVWITLYEGEELNLYASRREGVDAGTMVSPDEYEQKADIISRLIDQDRAVLIDTPGLDISADLTIEGNAYDSWISVPISWGGEKLGYLFLASKQIGVLETIHLETAISFARQLAIALQNARLLEGSHSRAEKLRLVNDIGRYAISVLDPQQLVEEVASRVRKVFGYYAVRILLVEDKDLVPYALEGEADDLVVDPHQTIALEEIKEISQAVFDDQPVYLDIRSPHWDYLIPSKLGKAQAAVIIPLSVVSEVIGVMEVYAPSVKALGQEDIDVLQVLAAQIAISVVNARLFSEIRSHATELESRVELRTQELRSQKERTEAILRSVADAILVLDLDGEVALTNPPALELLEGESGKALYESVRSLFVAEGIVQSSIEIGEVTYQALASPVELEGSAQGTVVVLRDITRLRELDQLKNQFVATVSHELRTPLTNIKLYLSLLRGAVEEKRAHYHKVLVRETERLSDMIEDLLNLSRLEAQGVVEKEAVSLAELIKLVADNHEPACISKGIDFKTDFGHRPQILADRTQIIQVFTNLLANAIAYTPVGGEISLRIEDTEEIDSFPYAKVILQDTGIGIRKEDIPHVFDRFYRGVEAQKYQVEGSGLGLAIVREILDNHDGKVAVDSQPGVGTKFTIWLPTLGE